MRIGILSDTHSRCQAVEKALALVRARRVNRLIHCGDIEDADTVRLFEGFTVHFVLGNCDHDRTELRRAVDEIGQWLDEQWGYLELDGVKMAFTHGDDQRLLRELEASGGFDYIFHGHTHQAADRRNGRTRIINPGALHRARPKTFVILDLQTGGAESVIVEQ
jgi:putative phosphoesterase